MKPSLHYLIKAAILSGVMNSEVMTDKLCDEMAEQIMKIVRDYHLVEENYRTVADDLETIRDGGG